MPTFSMTRAQACRYLLAYQGLWGPALGRGKPAVMRYMDRVRLIQYDPLNPCLRSPELALLARVPGFTPAVLNSCLYQDRTLIDGWDKCMCIHMAADRPCYAAYRALMHANLEPEHAEALDKARALLKESPLSSAQLQARIVAPAGKNHRGPGYGWNHGSYAKMLLETLYVLGDAVIHHKSGTQKTYALASNHLPADLLQAPDPFADNPEKRHDWQVLRRVRAIGLLWNRPGDAWLGLDILSGERTAAFERLCADGSLLSVTVEGIRGDFYLPVDQVALVVAVMDSKASARRTAFIAPLDNLIWERKMIKVLFDFSYGWEVYTPAPQRKYGYYVLPILCGERFVGRIEPWLDRASGALIIRGIWWEEGIRPKAYESAVAECARRLQVACGAKEVVWPSQSVDQVEA